MQPQNKESRPGALCLGVILLRLLIRDLSRNLDYFDGTIS